MIADPVVLATQRKAWASVRHTQDMLTSTLTFTWVSASGLMGSAVFDACHDLTLVFAYSVLKDVLFRLRDEKRFQCSKRDLKPLMYASRSALPWQDFVLVDKGRERRNEFAHEQAVVPVEECVRYVDAVEQELRAWGIVT